MNIITVETNTDFLSLKKDWDRLAEDLINVNSFDWTFKWWSHFKKNNELKILVAKKAGKVIGIAPLYIENTRALKYIAFKSLKFLGGNFSDYQDFLIQQDSDREITFKTLIEYAFNNLIFDSMELKHINSDYPNFDLWQKYTKTNKFYFMPYRKCLRIDLSKYNSYDDFCSKLNKNLKRSLKYRQNKIKKDCMNIEFVFKNSITEEDIKIISDINIKRQKYLSPKRSNKRYSFFLGEQNRAFIKEYFCSPESNSKMLALIKCCGKIAAFNLFLLNDKTISYWSTGFDPEYDNYCPTKFLICEVIKYAFENNYRYFDFLRGNDKYKYQWFNESTTNYIFSRNKTLKSRLVYLYRRNKPNLFSKISRKIDSEIAGINEDPIMGI